MSVQKRTVKVKQGEGAVLCNKEGNKITIIVDDGTGKKDRKLTTGEFLATVLAFVATDENALRAAIEAMQKRLDEKKEQVELEVQK